MDSERPAGGAAGGKSGPAGLPADRRGGWLPWRRKAPEQLNLRLEFSGRVLYEQADFSAAEAITIGRSSECTWVIPKEDSVASGHHAVIMMRGGRLCLRDTNSRNGIFCKSKQIREKILAPNDQISIGNCTLFVERVKRVQTAQHRLFYLNTDRKGQSVPLVRAKMTAGSAPGCDIAVDNQLVSQKHAEFTTKADGCWLRDLGSRNGTFVNGTRLLPSTERLLADNDVVSIAFVDFKFADGRTEHAQIRIWSSLGIIAVTIFIALALNWVWLGVESSSDSCLESARSEAAAENFTRARELLRESRTRRGAKDNEVAYHELERSMTLWENVRKNWLLTKSALGAGNWIEAARILGMITDADPNIWGWNDTTAPAMRKEAFAVKKLLDAFLRAETAMRDDSNREDIAGLKRSTAVILEAERLFPSPAPAFMAKLLTEAAALRRQIETNLKYLEKLDAILARLGSGPDELTAVLEDLEKLKRDAEPNIRIRIETCVVPLSMLQRTAKETARAIVLLRGLDFASLKKIKLDLPSLEQCSVNAHIATLRRQQERTFDAVLATADNLAPLIRQLKQSGFDAGSALPAYVRVFGDREVMKKVLACDSLDRPMPFRLRTAPSGEYDRLLGIEGFFEFIYALPAPYDPTIYSEFKFTPEIVRFRRLLSEIRTFRLFAEQKGLEWLRAGAFERLYERTAEVQAFRDKLVWDLTHAKYDLARQTVLVKAIAIFLADEQDSGPKMEAFCNEVKRLRLPLIRLGRDYNTAPDERKIVIRDQILQTGLPGDPVVRRMWGFKKYPK